MNSIDEEAGSQKRQFSVILIIVFLGFLGISMPYLIFPSLFLNPLFSIMPEGSSDFSRALFLGITLAAYPFGQFIGSPVLGSLSDDYGRKKILNTSLFITAFCNLFTGFAIKWEMLYLLILSRFIAGIMEGNIAIARAMASDLTTISKHNTFGKINAAASIAYLVGPLLGGLMTDKEIHESFTTTTPFYFICIFFFALTLLSVVVIENKPLKTVAKTRSFLKRLNLIKKFSLLFSNNRLRLLMITSTFFTIAVDIFYEFGPVYLTVKWGLNPSDLIYYNAILCLGLAIGNGCLPVFVSSRYSKSISIIVSIAAFSLFLIGIILTDSKFFMMSLFGLCGLVIGLGVTLITVKISNSISDSIQGEVMGAQVSLRVLGDAIICLLGGLLLLISPKLILVVAAVISLSSMFFYTLNKNKS